MDKNTYETYEYLPPPETNNAESDQFFVVQDDGTFLLNRQYPETQNEKEVMEDLQPCTVYGVSPQQFYVDVENNPELISVSDQFMLPTAPENSLYPDSYLLQPSSSTAPEQIEEGIVIDQFVDPNIQPPSPAPADIDISTQNKQGYNFTEITLTDQQYHMLEQKGWILLEANDKIFVLNTLGLHDITTNDKLIQKLRNEIQNETNSDSGSSVAGNISNELPNIDAQPFINQSDSAVFQIGNCDDLESTLENFQFVISENETKETVVKNDETNNDEASNIEKNNDETSNNEMNNFTEDSQSTEYSQETEGSPGIEDSPGTEDSQDSDTGMLIFKEDTLKNLSSIKIKTKFDYKDIPDKVVLGRTVDGKKLVAKVLKRQNGKNIDKPLKKKSRSILKKSLGDDDDQKYTLCMRETELLNHIQRYIRDTLHQKFKPEDVTSAESVIGHVLKIRNFKSLMLNKNVVITKIKCNKDENGKIYNKSDVILVTGRIVEKEDASAGFQHVPELLQTIKSKTYDAIAREDTDVESDDEYSDICKIFQVHVNETKCADNVIRMTVTLNKRRLSVNQMFEPKKRYPSTLFACSACAVLFKSEVNLKIHQENDCLDTEEMLTIDTDKFDIVDAYSMVNTEKDKAYTCKQCDAKFPKLHACLRHVKTHLGQRQRKQANKETTNENKSIAPKEIFKCKMCPSTYFHSATLTKHIMARHVKMKSK